MAGCEEWLDQTQGKVLSVASESFGHAKLVSNVPLGSRTISIESGGLTLKVFLYCPDKVSAFDPEAVVIARDENELTDDYILQLLDVEFRKRV